MIAMRFMIRCLLVCTTGALLMTTVAHAEESMSPQSCAPTAQMDKYRLLRRLSIDLRGRGPTVAELEALHDLDTVDEAMLDELLSSADYFAEVRRYHRSLLWGTLEDVTTIGSRRRQIRPHQDTGIWYAPQNSRLYRNGIASCVDRPAQFEGGRPRVFQRGVTGPGYERCQPSGCNLEGYVKVRPYWDRSVEIKVCAFDAQTAARGDSANCDSGSGALDPGCGCGPNLRRCVGIAKAEFSASTDETIRAALVEEPLRIFENIVREGKPYFEALTTRASYINGPLVHYYSHVGSTGTTDRPGMGALPNLGYDTNRWEKVQRTPGHSGVLTTLGFMMRFASNRARANRFYTAFLCQPFEPVDELPEATDPCSSNPDLAERCGCASCHATLEPAAAYWGRWRHGELYGQLDTTRFPNRRAECANCRGDGCSEECNDYYVTTANSGPREREHVGLLRALQWRSAAERQAVEQGPRALVERPGTLAMMEMCTAQTLASRLLHRELSEEEANEWVPSLASSFRDGDHDFTELVRTIVSSPPYRASR